MVVTGDGNGYIGIGVGKANEVPAAISKASAAAKRDLIKVSLSGDTIPHEIRVKFGAAKVMLKPASPGTGIIAGSSIRAVLEVVGIKDVLAKSLGNPNKVNLAKATVLALSKLKNQQEELKRRKIALNPEEDEIGE